MIRFLGFRPLAVAAMALLALAAPSARAQRPSAPELPNFAYNPSPPGARSLAMGASFIGLADDATAAESNPAGLTILRKPEVSAHVRYSSFDTTFPPDPEPTNRKVTSPNFFSYVDPHKHFSGSVYYHQAGNFDSGYGWNGFDWGCPCYVDTKSRFGFRLENFGLAAAFKPLSKLSVGGSVRVSKLTVNSPNSTYLGAEGVPTPEDDPDQPSPTLEDLFEGGLRGDDTDFTFNVGLMINPAGKLSVGLVYKFGGDYRVEAYWRHLQRDLIFRDDFTEVEGGREPVQIEVPDVIGGGAAYRPTDRWTVTGDLVYITYSDLRARQEEREAPLPDNELEFHVGTEYTLLRGNTPISLRVGYYHEPDHDALPDLDTTQNHFTFGGGVVLQDNFQLDGAVSLSEDRKEGLLSVVVRF